MISEKMIENYKKSLNQKYNAVCFDIDGTLTENNSKKIDERAIEMIANLLKRRIPVVFITGRGETGLNDLVNEILPVLKNKYKINKEGILRMYALINDGARLFITENYNDTLDKIFDKDIYISTDKQLNELVQFNNKFVASLNNLSLSHICKITYSIDSKTDTIINTRLVFNSNNNKVIDTIVDLIDAIIKNENMVDLNVTRGIFGNKTTIQIGTARKEYAIKEAERIIGIPENSMIRIGDCGDIRGNDYSMLNCPQGYSVDKISDSEECCFPVIDENNNILYGIDATLYLIKKAKILPTVCLEKADKYEYSKKYAKIEKQILKGRKSYLKKYNKLVNEIFDLENGINDLYDSSSGSIKIPMYEWELIDDNNLLKKLFNSKEEEKLLYSLRDNNNFLLRGSKTYYYFLANRKSSDNIDYTSSNNVLEWYYNMTDFILKSTDAIKNTSDLNELSNKKMILGLLDNIRNYLLLSLNHQLISKYEDINILINLDNIDNKLINNIYKALIDVDRMMANICFNKEYKINKDDIIKIQKRTLNLIYNEIELFNNNKIEKDYSKEFRAYREIDNFAENYITILLNNEKNNNTIPYGVCGMCYGGIELPIIYKIVNPELTDISLLKFNKKVSGYKNKQLVELVKFDINNYGGIEIIGKYENKNIVILDDNLLTGKTMQLVLNCMYDIGINVSNISIVRFPSINRVDQMFMEHHGAVDYRLFFDYVTGLCFPSPYSWRDENCIDAYTDSLGVFDLNRKKIIECLIKNHDYSEKSEVYEYKKKIRK